MHILTAFLLFICGFTSPLLAASKPLLPPIDLEFIIAGLSHTERQLISGTGHFKLFGVDYFSEKERIVDEKKETDTQNPQIDQRLIELNAVIERQFVFNKEHSYFKDIFADGTVAHVFLDGKIILYPGSPIAFNYGNLYEDVDDPRNWGIWFRGQKWSDYLWGQTEVRVIGSEAVDGIACYILEMPFPHAGYDVLQVWVAPKGGFRVVQTVRKSNNRELALKLEWQRYQLQTGVVWFPKHAVLLYRDEEGPLRNEVEITDFQPNIDVSSVFDLQILPETKVFHIELSQFTTFKEIGWRQPEPVSK